MPDDLKPTDADLVGPLRDPLTRGELRTRVTAIVHTAFPLPHHANCLRFADMIRVLVDLAEQIAVGREAPPGAQQPLFPDHGEVPQVCLHPALVDAFGVWLAARGLFLFRIPTGADQLPTYGVGIADDRTNVAAQGAVCTGLTATWCPVCGSCMCLSGKDLADLRHPVPGCPLHGNTSRHAEPVAAGADRTVFADEGRQWLRLATDPDARAAWMATAGLPANASPADVLAAVGRRYTLYGMFADAPEPTR
jgi:hypothetical protein